VSEENENSRPVEAQQGGLRSMRPSGRTQAVTGRRMRDFYVKDNAIAVAASSSPPILARSVYHRWRSPVRVHADSVFGSILLIGIRGVRHRTRVYAALIPLAATTRPAPLHSRFYLFGWLERPKAGLPSKPGVHSPWMVWCRSSWPNCGRSYQAVQLAPGRRWPKSSNVEPAPPVGGICFELVTVSQHSVTTIFRISFTRPFFWAWLFMAGFSPCNVGLNFKTMCERFLPAIETELRIGVADCCELVTATCAVNPGPATIPAGVLALVAVVRRRVHVSREDRPSDGLATWPLLALGRATPGPTIPGNITRNYRRIRSSETDESWRLELSAPEPELVAHRFARRCVTY